MITTITITITVTTVTITGTGGMDIAGVTATEDD